MSGRGGLERPLRRSTPGPARPGAPAPSFYTLAGRYSLVMANDGAEPHLMVLAQLEPGVTLEEAMASQGQEGVAASFESDVAPPGAEAVVTADLTAGDWILICPIPDAAGTTHVEHGMIHEFTLT